MRDKKIGIIGLGRVGIVVAKAYLDAGYKVEGVEVDQHKSGHFETMGGILSESPAAMAKTCNIILVLVLNDQQVKQVLCGANGVVSSQAEILTVVCMSTINRSTLEEVAAECASQGIDFVDCPFTGGPARVPTGSLTLVAAGAPSCLDTVKPTLELIGNLTIAGHIPGLGQAVKHCNQLLVGATHAATMELIALARRLGLDAELVCKVVGDGIAGSDYFKLLSDSVLQGTPSPGGLGQMCKDVSIVKNTADQVGLPALVASAAANYFKQAENRGMQHREGADLIEVVEDQSET